MRTSVIADVLIAAEIVHNELSTSCSERNYHNALEIELSYQNIDYISEPRYANTYKGVEIGYVNPDLIVFDGDSQTIVELKQSKKPESVEGQVEHYMNTADIDMGIAICFNESLEYDLFMR